MAVTPNTAAAAALRAPTFPPVPGAQIAPVGGDPGAICCFARRRGSAQVYAITAAHVATFFGRIGPSVPVWQPAQNGASSYCIGRNSSFRPTLRGWRDPPDCWAIELDDNQIDGVKLMGTGSGLSLKAPDFAMPRKGDVVAKAGPESGVTVGSVDQLAVNVLVQWTSGTRSIRRALAVSGRNGVPFAAPGDSGAPVFRENDGTLVGMVVAGSDDPSPNHLTIVMLARDVMESLKMDFAA